MKVVKEFTDPRIRYFLNPERTSLRQQLNQAIVASRGEFLARMDADDIAVRHRISQQLAYLAANDSVCLVGSNLEIIDEGGKTLGYRRFPADHDEISRKLRRYCAIAHPSVMFRKSVVTELGGYQVSAPMEDWDLWCRMVLSGKRLHNIQEPLLKYRVHAQAGKVLALRKTLRTGIALKKRHFHDLPGQWGCREALRCLLERLLLLLPPQVVVRLFLYAELRRRP